MASYNLNEMLKRNSGAKSSPADGEMHLDDTARVKILSPGRQVFKRFIRNKLAIAGSLILIAMFVFSFLGPVVYPYGQKEIFYKYDRQNINYGQAKERKDYTGFVLDDSVEVDRSAANMMNSNIRKMVAEDLDEMLSLGKDGSFYESRLMEDSIYYLSKVPAQEVCTFGSGRLHVGTFSMVGGKGVSYADSEPLGAGFEAAAAKNCKGSGGEFAHGGSTYTFEKGEKPKTFEIYTSSEGFVYTGAAMDEEFEAAVAEAEPGQRFTHSDKEYAVISTGSESFACYALGKAVPAMVYTSYAMDLRETGASVPDEFRVAALQGVVNGGSFTFDGQSYTLEEQEDSVLILDAAGEEYAEFSRFVIRRYSGDDSMSFELKSQLSDAIDDMVENGKKTTSLVCALPQQDANGLYVYDENGNLTYQDTEMTITQKDTGEFTINCEQIVYLIDTYADPSGTHLLGTDGDGFDVLARMMYGGRISLMVGFVVVLLEIVLGVIMGGLAGYFGGWVDNMIMRLVDIFYCLPMMPIMIIIGAVMDSLRMNTYVRLLVMMAALGVMGWAGVARLVRGQILSLREQEFMTATEATGVRISRRIFRHLIPNVMPQLIVVATMGLGSVILTESTLSYLGLGVKHPLATWGTMINSVSSATAMQHYVHIWVPVGLLICLTVIAFNFVGDGLRDAYDPRAKR